MADFDSKAFRRACGQFLTGVTVVTTRAADGTPVGLTANAFTSVSLDPPLVLVCVDKKSGSFPAFASTDTYAVHVLAQDQQELSATFATRGADRFAGVQWAEGLGGAPVFPAFLARFECSVAHRYEEGDHIILVGQVERLAVAEAQPEPLGFFRGQYRPG